MRAAVAGISQQDTVVDDCYLNDGKVGLTRDVSNAVVAQDLMHKFLDVAMDGVSQCEEQGPNDLSKGLEDITPVKRDLFHPRL